MDHAVQSRIERLEEMLEKDRNVHRLHARRLSALVQVCFWGSVACSAGAAAMGLIPADFVQKWHIGLLSAAAVGLLVVARQAKFQQKAQWHYRRMAGCRSLLIRLRTEMPAEPSVEDVAELGREYRTLMSEVLIDAVPLLEENAPVKETT